MKASPSPASTQPPTQKTIAREAGVSIETVSQILGGRYAHRYSEQTQTQVREVAQRLNYRPHRAAQMMRQGRSGLVGVLSSGGNSSLEQRKMMAVAHHLHRAGYELLVHDVLWFTEPGTPPAQRLVEARVEGVVSVNSPHLQKRDIEMLHDAGIPLVNLSSARAGTPSIYSDRLWGYRILREHLLSLGHRRIVFLLSADLNQTNSALGEDFLSAMCAVPGAEGLLHTVSHYPDGYRPSTPLEYHPCEPGERGMREILARHGRPDAVMCSNDEWALGALTACAREKLRVPDDVAITGFDAIPLTEAGYIPLTTIRYPVDEIGRKGAELLLKLMKQKRLTPDAVDQDTSIKGELVVRASTTPSS
ncbi:MAG TPA: LacI family DNA-binding transcriptional regulator [Chthoniobacteraceae bacterium]|nr:LacI family DNA-binding transcriptional regulator [Chthoniobacteraceae bacterium]